MSIGASELLAEEAAAPFSIELSPGGEITARSPLQLFWRRFRSDRVAMVSLGFIVVLILVAIFAPLVVNMEFMGAAEMAYFRAISTVVQGWASDLPPKVAIELARRGLASDVRPSQEELEKMLKSLDAG